MTRYFKPIQHALIDVYNWLLPLVTINILWFVLSLTVVLLPPATAALYGTAFQANRGEEPSVRGFLNATRHWLTKSWIWGVITLLLTIASIVAIEFYSFQQTDIGNILVVVNTLLIVFIGLVQFYFWPYMLQQDHPQIRAAFRNAAFTVLGDPLFVLFNVSITLVLLGVSILLIAPIAIITPITIAFLGVYSLQAWLELRDLLPSDNTENQH
jgi:uncharacterized membrane protein YesL